MAGPSVLVLEDEHHVALTAAELVANRLRARPRLRVLLPTGATPLGMYAALRAHRADGSLPTEHATALQLDEYLGLGRDDPRSFSATLDREIGPLGFGVREGLNGAAADPEAEVARYQAVLDAAPIDLAVLGIGRDAHVAFDEPGTRRDSGVHAVALDPSTIAANAAAFGGERDVPRDALTTGLATLRRAREVLVLATGRGKADAVRAMLEAPVDPHAPASLLRDHPCLTVLCDRAAAERLAPSRHRSSDRVAIVLGHREPGVSAEHRISEHSHVRLRRAEALCFQEDVRAVVLTGYTHTGGLSEAEQMQRTWEIDDVPTLLEVAGRDTAENASRSLPIVLAMGGVRRVVVVTSLWHVRAPFFFAPYRRHGLAVELRPARPLRGWGHLLAHELRQAPLAPRYRRAAFAAVRLPDGGSAASGAAATP